MKMITIIYKIYETLKQNTKKNPKLVIYTVHTTTGQVSIFFLLLFLGIYYFLTPSGIIINV